MKLVRKKVGAGSSLLGRNNGITNNTTKCCIPTRTIKTSSKLFRPGKTVLVQRVSVCPDLVNAPSNGLNKPFQRPSTKRRAYDQRAEQALQQASLGARRRFDGMKNIALRAKKPLNFKPIRKPEPKSSDTEDETDEEEDNGLPKPPDAPYDPILVWQSPHQGGEPKGLPTRPTKVTRHDEFGIEEIVEVQRPAPLEEYGKQNVIVPELVGRWLRPHQREGVTFIYQCVMGLKNFDGNGCILADDMGLGKTLQSVGLIYTLLKTTISAKGGPTAKRVIVVCPCSLVKNWESEFVKWLGPGAVKVLAIAEADRKSVEKNLDCFVRTKMFQVLVCSYECIRGHVGRLTKASASQDSVCDLLVCDEAHRLKNSENQTSKALNSLPVRRRVLLTGTPMQNDLQEFYAMADFTNQGVLGTPEQFRRHYEGPILRGREPNATAKQKERAAERQEEMSNIVNEFILRRTNTLNAKHLPPKLVQVVCCNLTDIQKDMYQHLVNSKDTQHILDGKQVNCLASIQLLMKLSNHPSLVVDEDKSYTSKAPTNKRSAASKKVKYNDDEEKESTAAPGADGIAKFLPYNTGGGGRGGFAPVHPEWSGKMNVLYRLMKEMRVPGNGNDKIVIISNYTQTLDLIGRMCKENSWRFCRLDGSVTMKKRQAMVEEFNDPSSTLVAFLLSSKAGGCGLNLIGANRLVLFDPDWNPAVDKQAAARCWRDGQKKRCFTYRFLATGTVEEKIFQRQLAKEGLQSVVDDKEQVNALSTKDLRNLFKLRTGTPSDTHDKLACTRCATISDTTEMEEQKVLPKKLAACRDLLDSMVAHEAAGPFLQPLDPTLHGRTKEEYENVVKQPMDFDTVRKKLDQPAGNASAYTSVSGFSKDVNRIFSNVVKLWNDDEEITIKSKVLQTWWLEQWTMLVPTLMSMKADDVETKEDEPVDDPVEEEILKHSANNPHNVRSENFQQQLGMPDEENMRSWSHHYSTESCDDPVFRNAMRGTDAVSFVFGLEVNWSLIEERQQMEEAKAIMEMESFKSCNGADDEESGDESESEFAAGPVKSNDNENSPASSPSSSSSSSDDDDDNDDGSDSPKVRSPKKKAAKKTIKSKSADRDEDEVDSSAEDDDGADLKDFIEEDGCGEESDGDASMSDGVAEAESDSEEEESEEESEEENKKEAAAGKNEENALVDSESEEEEQSQEENDDDVEDSTSNKDDSSSMLTPKGNKAAPSALSAEPSTVGSDDSEESPGFEAQVLEDSDAAGEAMDSSPEVLAEVANTQDSDTSPAAQAKVDLPQPGPNEWACTGCTLLNPKPKRKCTMCGKKKPPAAPRGTSRKKRSIGET